MKNVSDQFIQQVVSIRQKDEEKHFLYGYASANSTVNFENMAVLKQLSDYIGINQLSKTVRDFTWLNPVRLEDIELKCLRPVPLLIISRETGVRTLDNPKVVNIQIELLSDSFSISNYLFKEIRFQKGKIDILSPILLKRPVRFLTSHGLVDYFYKHQVEFKLGENAKLEIVLELNGLDIPVHLRIKK